MSENTEIKKIIESLCKAVIILGAFGLTIVGFMLSPILGILGCILLFCCFCE